MRYAAAILTLLLICGAAVAAQRNVVLFVADDQGRDAGCYGNPVLKTPNLDRLAAEGTRFDNAYCTTASCSPSRSVILSGMFDHANGMYGLEHRYHHFRSFDNVKSLPVILGSAGYRTARVGKYHVGPEPVYHFDQVLGGNSRNPVDMAERSRKLIELRSNRPFFLYFATNDPHRGARAKWAPLMPNSFGNERPGHEPPGVVPVHYKPENVIVPPFLPDTPVCRAELAQYYESVSRVDAGLGRLMEILRNAGKYDDTLILYVSDNGIAFPGAKTTAYEPGLKLPCIVRNPLANKRGVVNQAFVSWIDIVPTILEFAGVKAPDDAKLQGRSLMPILEQEKPAGWDEVYASHTFHEVTMYYPMRVVRSGRFKLIWNIAYPLSYPFASDLWGSATWQDTIKHHDEDYIYGKRSINAYEHRPQFELYDLHADPDEIHNLANDPAHHDTLVALNKKLKEFQKRTKDPWIIKWQHE
ncbi:MAG TPA: sulfatase [Lacipirellulaceae bacterium]|nr:sulfatase [Lacipirellulaceae bacterium]